MALPCAWVSWPRLHANQSYSSAFHIATISLWQSSIFLATQTASTLYVFDSFQNSMDKGIQHILALLLMEITHCEVDPTSALYEAEAVDKFKATCMRFVQVKVCHVVVQSSTHFSFTPSN